jgi:hypothetical protein
VKGHFRNFGEARYMSINVRKITGMISMGYLVLPCTDTGITRSRLPLRLAAYWPSLGCAWPAVERIHKEVLDFKRIEARDWDYAFLPVQQFSTIGDPPKDGTERWTPVGNLGNSLVF